MLSVFTSDKDVIEIGRIGFRFVGVSFIPMVTSLIYLIKLKDNGGGIKLKKHRLFASKEEAEASISKTKPKYRSPYE